jgi:hypothetical protein
MGKKKGVSLIVDERFFNAFEKERQREQMKLRKEFGGMFNLSQRNFTAMLAAKNFKFQVPTNVNPKRQIRKRRRR